VSRSPAALLRGGLVLAACVIGGAARADDSVAPQAPPLPGSIEDRLHLLEQKNARLEEEVKNLRADHDSLEERHNKLSSRLAGMFTGYIDMGFFWASGDGSGIRPDLGHLVFPGEYDSIPDSWVFMGDPLSTTVNSRGDVADTQDSRAVTFNPVHNGGKASFIVNNIRLGIFAGLTPNLTMNAAIDFIPRGRNVSDPKGLFLGDYVEVPLAYFEYTIPVRKLDLRVTAGKFDSVLGIEYRTQDAPDRITVTPSLICRYTCGRPLGVKMRLRLRDDLFTATLAVTNGSHFIENFDFHNEIDTNYFKTVAARISVKAPVGRGLEIGASGSIGAQDFQSDDKVLQWHYGFDLRFDIRDFMLRAEFVMGRATGKEDEGPPAIECGLAPCLDYKGAYALVAYRVLNWLMPYARVDWRDAEHRDGNNFAYVANEVRVTGGVRLEVTEHLILKAEYTYNRELGEIPQFPNDVFTSSLILRY
jgi:hypothetical protein